MSLWRPAQHASAPTEKAMVEMGRLFEEMSKAGVLIQMGGWTDLPLHPVLTSSNGTVTVTEGPDTETKEVIAGLALMEVTSKAEAVEWGVRFLKLAGDGT